MFKHRIYEYYVTYVIATLLFFWQSLYQLFRLMSFLHEFACGNNNLTRDTIATFSRWLNWKEGAGSLQSAIPYFTYNFLMCFGLSSALGVIRAITTILGHNKLMMEDVLNAAGFLLNDELACPSSVRTHSDLWPQYKQIATIVCNNGLSLSNSFKSFIWNKSPLEKCKQIVKRNY